MQLRMLLTGMVAVSLLSACGRSAHEPRLSEMGTPVAASGGLVRLQYDGFSVPALVLTIRGEEVLLFEYPDAAATEADLAQLSADGLRMGDRALPWTPPVHIFATGTQIAVYRGSTEAVLAALASEGGPQVAGDSVPVQVEVAPVGAS